MKQARTKQQGSPQKRGSNQKIILYYRFTPLSDPEAVRLWQTALCQSLGLRGRIIISPHGINGTLGGDIEALKNYIRHTKAYAPFKDIDYKWTAGGASDFPRLSVKIRPELVAFGVPDQIEVDEKGVVGGGRHLTPGQLHQLVAQRGDDVVFFDGRNAYEAAIGRFKGAVVPATGTSKDFLNELAGDTYQDIKHKPVVTYCTGGIRCEVLSSLMKQRGFQEVYQLDGGIVRYGQEYGDDGLWEGSLYVFDGRIATTFSDRAVDIGQCAYCGQATSRYVNCRVPTCNRLLLICQACAARAECPACYNTSKHKR